MNKKHNSMAEYVLWLIKQYHEVKQSYSANAYRVVDIETDKTGKLAVIVQVCGKHITFKLTPQEILADDNMLEGFSKKDIRAITYLAFNDKKPKAKIVLQEFCEKLNRVVFGIKSPGKEQILKKTAGEISLDKNLLKDLSAEEARMIGHMTADDTAAEHHTQIQAKTKN